MWVLKVLSRDQSNFKLQQQYTRNAHTGTPSATFKKAIADSVGIWCVERQKLLIFHRLAAKHSHGIRMLILWLPQLWTLHTFTTTSPHVIWPQPELYDLWFKLWGWISDYNFIRMTVVQSGWGAANITHSLQNETRHWIWMTAAQHAVVPLRNHVPKW